MALTEEQKDIIRYEREVNDLSYNAIHKKHGISRTTVSRYCRANGLAVPVPEKVLIANKRTGLKLQTGYSLNELRAEAKAKGLCQECLKNPADGYYCDECRAKYRRKQRKRHRKRKENGLCVLCKKKTDNGRLCEECKLKYSIKHGRLKYKVYFPICKICGKQFTTNTKRQKTCSKECSDIWCVKYARQKLREDKGLILNKRFCLNCNKYFETWWHNRYCCSNKCRAEYLKKNAKNHPFIEKTCLYCNRIYSTNIPHQVYCTEKCARKAATERHSERIKKNYIEDVSLKYIYWRDKGRCQICGKKVYLKKKWHPKMATRDHIIPLSEGGKHEKKNIQLACSMCNSIKNNGTIDQGEQLRLFG